MEQRTSGCPCGISKKQPIPGIHGGGTKSLARTPCAGRPIYGVKRHGAPVASQKNGLGPVFGGAENPARTLYAGRPKLRALRYEAALAGAHVASRRNGLGPVFGGDQKSGPRPVCWKNIHDPVFGGTENLAFAPHNGRPKFGAPSYRAACWQGPCGILKKGLGLVFGAEAFSSMLAGAPVA